MINPFNLLFKIPPSRLYVASLSISSAIALWSYAVGAGAFTAQVVFDFGEAGQTSPRDIPLGYLQQLNFGPWHLALCPFLFASAGFMAILTDRYAPEHLRDRCSFLSLGERRLFVWLAFLMLVLFVAKNLLVEVTVYKNQSLGWVRADQIAEISHEKDGRVEGFSWVVDDRGMLRRPESVIVKSVTPANFKVRSSLELALLIAVAKAWVGMWEALVIYVTLLAAFAGTAALRTLTFEAVRDASEGAYGLKWGRTPMLYLLMISTFVNLSHIARAISNINKGTYGTLDQVISLVTLAPGVVAFFLWLGVIYRIQLAGAEADVVATKTLTLWFGAWTSTFVFAAFLVSGYFDPNSQKQIVQVVNQINPITTSGSDK